MGATTVNASVSIPIRSQNAMKPPPGGTEASVSGRFIEVFATGTVGTVNVPGAT